MYNICEYCYTNVTQIIINNKCIKILKGKLCNVCIICHKKFIHINHLCEHLQCHNLVAQNTTEYNISSYILVNIKNTFPI